MANPKDWKVRKLIEVSDFENGDRSSNYPSGDQIKEEGVLFLSTKNIVDNKLDLSSAVFITEEKFRSLSRGKARRHDLIITLRGTLGSCCVFDCEHERAFINAQMMIIRPQEAVLYKYLHALITLPQAKAHFMRIGFGAAVQQLTASQLAELVIPVPPLELQQKFAQEITAAEEMRRKLENSATEIADLFAAVQHRAFRGEL
jgi:type I restriction enzyme S subunit